MPDYINDKNRKSLKCKKERIEESNNKKNIKYEY